MSLFDLKDKVAIVTGSSRGIGRSIAHQLAKAGAKVVVSSRKLDACEKVVEEIRAAGGQAMAIAASISNKEQLEALVTQTRAAWGPSTSWSCNSGHQPVLRSDHGHDGRCVRQGHAQQRSPTAHREAETAKAHRG